MKGGDEEGFALVATLWFVALLALAAVLIEGWVSTSLDRSNALAERIATRGALFSAEQRVAYMLAIATASPRGLELGPREVSPGRQSEETADFAVGNGPFLALDDRPYRIGDILVTLQDGAGLFDVNSGNREGLGRLLRAYGTNGAEADSLTGALLQYRQKPTDRSDVRIADTGYQQLGLPPPRHASLLTPWELLRVRGWAGRDRLWMPPTPLHQIGGLGPVGGLNINSAPTVILTTLAGMDARQAAQLVAVRAQHPVRDLRELGDIVSDKPEDGSLVFVPSNIVRLTLSEFGSEVKDLRIRIVEIRVTPAGAAPLRVDYAVAMPGNLISRGAATTFPVSY